MCHGRAHGREGHLADAQGICRRDRCARNRTPRPTTHVREAVPGGRWRTRTDAVAAGPRIGSDDRALSWHQAGFGECAERRDTTEGGRLAPPTTSLGEAEVGSTDEAGGMALREKELVADRAAVESMP